MNNISSEYVVQRLDKNNIADLEKLYESVYKIRKSSSYFFNKYGTAYTGVSNIGYIAYKEKTSVAFYGVIPCFIQYDNRIILAAQSADTMTHPAHRHKGLFTALASMCFELAKKNAVRLIFGFPNQNSYYGLIKSGMQVTERMSCFRISMPVNTYKKIMASFNKTNINRVLKMYETEEKGIENSVVGDGFAGVYRDEKYLQYKTYNKTHVLKTGDAKVWINIGDSLTIGDMACNEKFFSGTIDTIKKIAVDLAIPVIYFHACQNTSLYKLFSAAFQSMPSFPVIFLSFYNDVDIKKIKFTFADIDIF